MTRITLVALALFLSTSVSAHHSLAGFDRSEVVEIEGELIKVTWRNPHIGFTVRVLDENMQDETWTIAGWGSAYSMKRTGVRREDFKTGDRVKMAGFLSDHRENELLVSHMLLSSGVEAIIRPDAEPRWSDKQLGGRTNWFAEEIKIQDAAKENLGIFRVWSASGYYNSLSTSEVHTPFTEAAVAARADWDPLDNFVTRCEQAGMPHIMAQPHPFEFEDRGSSILLHGEVWDITRTIEMDPAAGDGELEYPHFGRSVGHWEGRTLIVETTNIRWPYFDAGGTPQSEAVEVREEFALSEDQSRLDYRQIVTDPETFTEPATLETYWLALGEQRGLYGCED